MAEIVRVLKPGGSFVFNHSFHNKSCPSHIIHNFVRNLNIFNKNPIYLQQYTAQEVEEILANAGMKAKCPQYTVEPTKEYAILPQKIKGIPVPFARSINQSLKPSNTQKAVFAYGFSAYSIPLV